MDRIIPLQNKRSLPNSLKIGLGFAVLVLIILTGPRLEAETFPDRPVQLIIPFATGSGNDMLARAIQPYTEKALGVRLIISNIPGADGRIGMTRISKAIPDGYTIGLHNFPTPIIQEFLFDVPYKSLDFTFIYAWARNLNLLFVSENSNWKSFDDFVLEARKRPLSVGLPSYGTASHLLALILERTMNIKLNFVTFSGSAEGFTMLAGNHIDANIGSADTALGLTRAKKVRPILSMSASPNPNFPDVPQSVKYNMPVIALIRGAFGPPNIPAARVRVLEKAFFRAAAEPKLAEWLKIRATELISLDAKQYREEVEKQQALVREYKDLLKAH